MSTDRRDTGKGQLLRGFVLDDAVRMVVSLDHAVRMVFSLDDPVRMEVSVDDAVRMVVSRDDAVRVYFCGGTSLSVRDV